MLLADQSPVKAYVHVSVRAWRTASGTAEREAALVMVDALRDRRRITLGATKATTPRSSLLISALET
jgi:hypothetical protein